MSWSPDGSTIVSQRFMQGSSYIVLVGNLEILRRYLPEAVVDLVHVTSADGPLDAADR